MFLTGKNCSAAVRFVMSLSLVLFLCSPALVREFPEGGGGGGGKYQEGLAAFKSERLVKFD